MLRPDRKVAFGVALLAAALGFVMVRAGVSTRSPSPAGSIRNDPSPELAGIAGWINSEPLTIRALRGKVVLIDFWTYSCVNCVRTFPFLRALHETYGDHGLRIVGLHSPEFGFERNRANVEREVARNEITWPVALDNDMATWRAYRNRFWPHVYLIDRQGRIRFDHIGEGGEALIERRIRELLPGESLPPPLRFEERELPSSLPSETYLGYGRGAFSLGNEEGFRHDEAFRYTAPDPEAVAGAGRSGAFFLAGRWEARGEFVRSAEGGARIILPFDARDVFVVAGADRDTDIEVLLDGKPLSAPGNDVRDSTLRVGEHRLYHVVRLDEMETHVLTLRPADRDVSFYTFTFG